MAVYGTMATPLQRMVMRSKSKKWSKEILIKWPIKQLIAGKFAFLTSHHEEEILIFFTSGNDLNSLCSLLCKESLDTII